MKLLNKISLALAMCFATMGVFCIGAATCYAAEAPLSGDAYALYDAGDHSLVFDRGQIPVLESDQQVFTGFETDSYTTETTPWAQIAPTVATVEFKGVVRPLSTAYWFSGFRNAVGFDLKRLDTSHVTDMSSMFKSCMRLNNVDVTGFDTSNVTKMESMFDGCVNLGYLDVTHWDTSKVTTMYAMFLACKSLTYIDLSHWDTSKVENMGVMFSDTDHLVSIDLTGLDTSSIESMHLMFFGCYQLTDLDLSSFTSEKLIGPGLTGVSGGYSFFGYSLSEREGWTRMLQRITMNGAYTTYGDFTFPTQTPDKVADADGLWYDAEGNSYSGQVPSNKACTYYGSPTMASKIDISSAILSHAGTLPQATGDAVEPSFTVTFNDGQLQEGRDYDLVFFNNNYKGIATVAAYGKGTYRGVALSTFALDGSYMPADESFEPKPAQVKIPTEVAVGGVRYAINAKKTTAKVAGLTAKGKKKASLSICARIAGKGWSIKVIGIAPKAFKDSKVTTLKLKGVALSKGNTKNSLKGSAVKVIKAQASGSKKTQKAYLSQCKKWFKASNCGKCVAIR